MITWDSEGQDGSNKGIYAQRYDADGNTSGSEFQVNTYTSGSYYSPSATPLAGGGFLIAWMSESGQDGIYTYNVYAQIYNNAGAKQGNEFQVNTYEAGFHSVATTPINDGFIATWVSNSDDFSYDISAQMYDSEGNPLSVVTLNEVTTNTPPTLIDFTMSDHTAMATVNEDSYYEHNTSRHSNLLCNTSRRYSATKLA